MEQVIVSEGQSRSFFRLNNCEKTSWMRVSCSFFFCFLLSPCSHRCAVSTALRVEPALSKFTNAQPDGLRHFTSRSFLCQLPCWVPFHTTLSGILFSKVCKQTGNECNCHSDAVTADFLFVHHLVLKTLPPQGNCSGQQEGVCSQRFRVGRCVALNFRFHCSSREQQRA